MVSTCARSASRDPADPGVDLVEHEGFASGDGGERKGDAGQLSAGRGLRDRREREARVGPYQEHRLVGPCRAGIASVELDDELALPQPEALELRGDRLGEQARLRAPDRP